MQSAQTTDQDLLNEALDIEQQAEEKRIQNQRVREFQKTLPKEELDALTNEARIIAIQKQKKSSFPEHFLYQIERDIALRALIAQRYLNK